MASARTYSLVSVFWSDAVPPLDTEVLKLASDPASLLTTKYWPEKELLTVTSPLLGMVQLPLASAVTFWPLLPDTKMCGMP